MANLYSNFSKSKQFRNHLINSYEIMKDVFDFLQINVKDPKTLSKSLESYSTQKQNYNESNEQFTKNNGKLLESDQTFNKRPKITSKSKSNQTNIYKNNNKANDFIENNNDQFNYDSYFEEFAETHKGACDFVITQDCFESSDFVFPNVSSSKRDEIIKHCEDLTNTSVPMRIVSFSQAFRAIFKLIDDRISMNNHYKMALFSAHDSSVAEMLSALGQEVKVNPPYASFVITELLKKGAQYYIRFSFNGKVIEVPKKLVGDGCGGGIYSFHEFRMNFQPLIDHCHDFDEL